MSLINDALKRTKDVQQQTPPAADGPALRPVDPAQAKAASSARSFLFIMVVAVIVGNFLLWLAFHEKPQGKDSKPSTSPDVDSTPAVVAVAPAAVAPPVIPAPEPVVATNPSAPGAIETSVSSAPASHATSTAPAMVFAEPPKPTVLRLQSIIYGTRPSAMIAGKFLFVGDSIQGHKVIAIGRETVTLAGNGQTNVLSLP
jgi:hypothetical protein